MTETSNFRNPAHNARAGGVPNSLHTQGDARRRVAKALDGNWAWAPVGTIAFARQVALVQSVAAKHGLRVRLHNAGSGFHAHFSEMGN